MSIKIRTQVALASSPLATSSAIAVHGFEYNPLPNSLSAKYEKLKRFYHWYCPLILPHFRVFSNCDASRKASNGGTAFPICVQTSDLNPSNLYQSGNDCILAPSRGVNARFWL